MQEIKFPKPGEDYDSRFLFINHLINNFTARLNVREKFFYYAINRFLKSDKFLKQFSYMENGLRGYGRQESFETVFERYKQDRESGNFYGIAPFLNSMSRLISLIYIKAAKIKGSQEALRIFKISYEEAKKDYNELDLSGYLPPEAFGSSSSSSSSSSAFGLQIMDNIIDFLIKEAKGKQTEEIAEKEKITAEKNTSEEIMELYNKILGPIGYSYFYKIKGNLSYPNILKQVEFFKDTGIIAPQEYSRFKKKLANIFGPEENPGVLEKLAMDRKISIDYQKLVQELVNAIYKLYGPIAVERANRIKGLHVRLDGNIEKILGDKKAILDELSRSYKDIAGDLGRFIKEKELRFLLQGSKQIGIEDIKKAGLRKEKI